MYKDENLKRQFQLLDKPGDTILSDDKYRQLIETISDMQKNYAKVRICSFKDDKKCDFQLEPELKEILATSRNADELKYYWVQWHDKAGTPVKQEFETYVKLTNEASQLNSQ